MSKGTAVEKAKPGLPELPAELGSFLPPSGETGLEGLASDDFQYPMISIVQGLSPELDVGSPKYIDGARAGQMFNSLTREILPDTIEVIPLVMRSSYLEWVPREAGGGFVAEYATEEEAHDMMEPGHEIQKSTTVIVMYRPSPHHPYNVAIIPFDRTKLKIVRGWASMLQILKVKHNGKDVTPPIWMSQWALSSVRQSNAKGVFYNFAIRSLGLNTEVETLKEAQELSDGLKHMSLRGPNKPKAQISEEDKDFDKAEM